MIRLPILCIALWLWASCGLAHAGVVFNAESATVSLNGKMQFLPDNDNQFSLADVLLAQQEGRMQDLPGQLNRGYAPVASWLSFVVTNDGATHVSPTLVMAPPFLDEVDVYIRKGVDAGQAGEYRRFSVGDHTPVADQPLPTALMTVPLSIEPGASLRVFIRIHSLSAHRLAAELVSPQQFQTKTARHLIGQSAYGALPLALAIINFLMALRLRDRIYALYGTHLLMLFCAYAGVEGIIRVLLPATAHHLSDWFVGGGFGIGFASISLFVISLFNTAVHNRWAHRYLQFTVAIGVAVCLSNGTHWYATFAQLLQVTGIGISFLLPWLAWRSIKRGQVATGRLFLIAFGASNVGTIINILAVLNVLPLGEFTLLAGQITGVAHMLVMMMGFSERILVAEAELRQASNQAEAKAVALASQMNVELIDNKKELERSLNSERRIRDEQGRFIDTISHEYRTPLSIVRTNLDILHAKQQIEEKRFGVITSALSRLEDVFSDTLRAHNLGRPPPPKFAAIDLQALLDEALNETRQAAPNCPFDYSTVPDSLTTFGDAGLIFTVLRNLLGNAAKYRTGGPVIVTLRRAGEQALLVVDNAIDASSVLDHERLFERWERGSATAGKSGMGLGLYLVRRIVHDHAGEVAIATEPSDRFIITLKLPLFHDDIIG